MSSAASDEEEDMDETQQSDEEEDIDETQQSITLAQSTEPQELYIRGERLTVVGDSRRYSFDDSEGPTEPAKRGRPLNAIWAFFKQDVPTPPEKKKTHPNCACKLCGKPIKNGKPSSNLKHHLLKKCPKITALQMLEVEKMFPPETPPKKHSKKPRVEESSSQTTPEAHPPLFANQTEFELDYARMVFRLNFPWNLVNIPTWSRHYKNTSPEFRLPTRQKLAGVLLDAVYEEVRVKTIAKIKKRQVVSIVTDGWTNPNRASIVNFVVVAPGMKALLWTSHATGAERHTGPNLKTKLEAVIDEVEAASKATIAGVLTDNAPNQINSWELLEKDRPIFGGGCAAHTVNLLMLDIMNHPEVKKIVEKAMLPIRFVRDHQVMQHLFNELLDELPEGQPHHQLSLPCPTRWYSTVQSLKSVHQNESILERLFVGEKRHETMALYSDTPAQKKAVKSIQNLWLGDFWTQLRTLLGMLDPIMKALADLESDKSSTSRVYERFEWLLEHHAYGRGSDSQTPLQEFIVSAIESRWNFVHTNAMGIAFLLDPRTKNREFMGTDKKDSIKQAIEFVKKGSIKYPSILTAMNASEGEFVASLHAFEAQKSRGELTVSREDDPRDWWCVYGDEFPVVQRLAFYVFAIPTSTAASERMWSIFGNIHSDKRSKTEVERVNKLAFIYANNDFDTDA